MNYKILFVIFFSLLIKNNLMGIDARITIELVQENGAPVLFANVKANGKVIQPPKMAIIPVGVEPISTASYPLSINNRYLIPVEKSGKIKVIINHPDFQEVKLTLNDTPNRGSFERIVLKPKEKLPDKLLSGKQNRPYYNSLLTVISDEQIGSDFQKKLERKGTNIVHHDAQHHLSILKIDEHCLKNKASIIEFIKSNNKLNVFQVLSLGRTSISYCADGVYVEMNNAITPKNFREIIAQNEIDIERIKKRFFLKNRTPIDYLDFFQKIEKIEFIDRIVPAGNNTITF